VQTTEQNPAALLLDEAKAIVTGARAEAYGKVEDNFTRIAEFWSTFKNVSFSAQDVAAMMALLKLARLANQPGHHDSVVDLAGYAACYARCTTSTLASEPLSSIALKMTADGLVPDVPWKTGPLNSNLIHRA